MKWKISRHKHLRTHLRWSSFWPGCDPRQVWQLLTSHPVQTCSPEASEWEACCPACRSRTALNAQKMQIWRRCVVECFHHEASLIWWTCVFSCVFAHLYLALWLTAASPLAPRSLKTNRTAGSAESSSSSSVTLNRGMTDMYIWY